MLLERSLSDSERTCSFLLQVRFTCEPVLPGVILPAGHQGTGSETALFPEALMFT